MSEQDTAAMLAALQAQMAALAAGHAPPSATAAQAGAWGVPAPAPVQIVGVSIPIKYQTPLGGIKILLTLPAECAATPAALDVSLQNIMALGFELDTWQKKEQGGWGGNNRGGNSGGWRR